jgi:NDP-sugar pyrophosphorylase family protein
VQPRIGVISVGGRGIRLGRADVQKCLIQIGGKPILEYTVSAFAQNGLKAVYLLTGYLNKQIDDYLRKRSRGDGVALASVYGGTEGQIPALLALRDFLKEDFIYAGGDCIFSPKVVRALIRDATRHRSSVAVMAANRLNETVTSHPRIELIKGSRLVNAVHDPGVAGAYELVGMGMYYFRPRIFDFFSTVRGTSVSPTSEFVKHAKIAQESIAVSTTQYPWFCLHTLNDLQILQSLDLEKFLAASS